MTNSLWAKRLGTLVVVALALVPAAQPASAAVPALVNYQGRLLRTDGTPESGILSMTFALHDAATGGTALWTETQSVAFTDGFYSVLLGSVAALPLTVLNDPNRWLAVTVGGSELAPRQPVVSVPFALRSGVAEVLAAGATGSGSGLDADSVDGLDGADLATATHTHSMYAPTAHTHPAGDAATLDGIDSTGFATGTHTHTSFPGPISVGGSVDWGTGSDDDLSAADVTTLAGGGNADALHTHAGLPSPWFVCGGLADLDAGGCAIAAYPPASYEYGFSYNNTTITPGECTSWNFGKRFYNRLPYVVLSDDPSVSMNWGGAVWYTGTLATDDDACSGSTWRHRYWYLNSTLAITPSSSNGCFDITVYCREL